MVTSNLYVYYIIPDFVSMSESVAHVTLHLPSCSCTDGRHRPVCSFALAAFVFLYDMCDVLRHIEARGSCVCHFFAPLHPLPFVFSHPVSCAPPLSNPSQLHLWPFLYIYIHIVMTMRRQQLEVHVPLDRVTDYRTKRHDRKYRPSSTIKVQTDLREGRAFQLSSKRYA